METPELLGLETQEAEKSEITAHEGGDAHAATANGAAEEAGSRGVKRPAEDDLDGDDDDDDDDDEGVHSHDGADVTTEAPQMSKNQRKKLRRQKAWEDGKADRQAKKKELRRQKQERKREAKQAEIAAAAAEGREPVLLGPKRPDRGRKWAPSPVTIIVDCQFEKYMSEAEQVSLANQVTRSYSDNRNAKYPAHLFISSYGGNLQARHETVLQNQHKGWKGVHFCEGDFVAAAKEAQELMEQTEKDEIIDLLRQDEITEAAITMNEPTSIKQRKKAEMNTAPEPEAADVDKSIVYLTADSPYTIERLEPNTSYVVGGIIDKNREKGLCYKIARERNVRTAKLPIGEYMVLQHRHILATNHVVEIMLKWLESGNWATAFMSVIPTRKGGKLKDAEAGETVASENGADEDSQLLDKGEVDNPDGEE